MELMKGFLLAFALLLCLVPFVGCGPSYMSEEAAQQQAGEDEDKDDPNDGAKPE